MQHKMIPLFSVPLIKTNIGAIDQIAKAWIRDLDYPHQSTGTDHSAVSYTHLRAHET